MSSRVLIREIEQYVGKQVRLAGFVQACRDLGNICFLKIRDHSGSVQVVVEEGEALDAAKQIRVECPVSVIGVVVQSVDKGTGSSVPGKVIVRGLEIHATAISAYAELSEPLPVEVHKTNKMDNLSLNTMLNYRPLTVRNEKTLAIFKIESEICQAYRNFLLAQDFVEIHSPKIVSTCTEGGANLFAIEYFGTKAYLAQSPQFYKQIMVGAYERVFEIGPVYRAEEHDTTRHMNEYISLDFEMGFISGEGDVIKLHEDLLKHVFGHLTEKCDAELKLFHACVPEIKAIPRITLAEAMVLLKEHCNWHPRETEVLDLDPEGEQRICDYFKHHEGCELVYVTHYPRAVRPFYTMPYFDAVVEHQAHQQTVLADQNPLPGFADLQEFPELTRSFDLLFRGLEVTTGGQRIHSPQMLIRSIEERGMRPEDFSDYLQCFKYGMPPHGGQATGLERLTKQLLGLPTVKLASLFPRDCHRLTP